MESGARRTVFGGDATGAGQRGGKGGEKLGFHGMAG